ncbi:MAG: malto-oligosyltrehalose synthase [Cyclobacteriaceae bacterium]
MHIPSATYRIQLHKDFTFKDLQRILEYLHTLGISTIYASPIMQATPGSLHGYDVTDPHTINSELGTPDDFKTLAREVKKKDMFWLQDIVPNHMAFHIGNYRLMDVLERGPHSPYYNYFDINWNHHSPELKGKVMVPFLGKELSTCIEDGEIRLAISENGIKVKYMDTAYPLSVSAYPIIIKALENDDDDPFLRGKLNDLLSGSENIAFQAWEVLQQGFIGALEKSPADLSKLEEVIAAINDDNKKLLEVINSQYYRLCFWKETDSQINYRRFFTVNELICLRMEDKKVFEEYHTYLYKLYKDKIIHGLRIDHIDGLKDPGQYTKDLRNLVGESCYLIAEKILEAKEDMPEHWPLEGTSGYEFLSFLNQLLTHRKGAKQLLNFYKELMPDIPSYRKLIFESKTLILENYMKGEWENLTELFRLDGLQGEFDIARIKQALGLFMLSLPVYRIYPESLPLKGQSLLTVHDAFEKALLADESYIRELNYIKELFTTPPADQNANARVLSFLQRLMQFTGPLTAKGVEDTTFYIYNPLISHDEVGDAPATLGMSIQAFHEKMLIRQAATPLSLNATATHDTKRGEDARVRLNVLSRIPELWKEHVTEWIRMNATFRKEMNGKTVPQLNDEYFIYQSMVGGFPEDFQITDEWIKRVQAYLNKSLREAKVNTNWSEPDEQYEKGCNDFIKKIVGERHHFLPSFIPFIKTVYEHAMVYTLSQTLVKLTAPGIPDIYQGCELWDLSFVDPDNRRPVDYNMRMELLWQLVLKEQKGKDAVMEFLREHRQAGIEKLFVTWKTLNFRKSQPLLFIKGDYIPLQISGKDLSAAAYARKNGQSWVMVVIPLGLVKHDMNIENVSGPDQFIILPEDSPAQWTNLFTGEIFESPNQISIQDIFKEFPVALLVNSA